MLRLRTFGGLTLAVGEEVLTGTTTQRRRLALLALLAVVRERGMSRDKILAYLWAESDTERARHSLEQLLYLQRRHSPGGRLFLGSKTLRLNREVISTDVGEFEDALDRGEMEAAVALYTGPFLDGFFLKRAPEFEEWVEDQRTRLLARCTAALGRLARSATTRGQQAQAIDWWRRVAELSPFDSETAINLVRALAAAGNRAGAIHEADAHQQRLHDKLGLAPDPRLGSLVQQLQGAQGRTPQTREK